MSKTITEVSVYTYWGLRTYLWILNDCTRSLWTKDEKWFRISLHIVQSTFCTSQKGHSINWQCYASWSVNRFVLSLLTTNHQVVVWYYPWLYNTRAVGICSVQTITEVSVYWGIRTYLMFLNDSFRWTLQTKDEKWFRISLHIVQGIFRTSLKRHSINCYASWSVNRLVLSLLITNHQAVVWYYPWLGNARPVGIRSVLNHHWGISLHLLRNKNIP